MGYEDLKIRDLSRHSNEWTPPIGAMGGPPAHELYTDLVRYAGLQLFRDGKGRPWVVLRDGAQPRAFLVPSAELRSALDRFRMHRNLRPVPESHIEEFVRLVQARISDPDVAIPILRSPVVERTSAPERNPPPPPPARPAVQRWKEMEDQFESALQEIDNLDRHSPNSVEPRTSPAAPNDVEGDDTAVAVPGSAMNTSISGARLLPARRSAELARYVGVLRELVRDGSWMGTTQELSKLTQADPFTLFDSLLQYRFELEKNDILVTNIEVEDGIRWLVVDRAKTRTATAARPPEDRILLAK